MKNSEEIDGEFNYKMFYRHLQAKIPDDGIFVEVGASLGKSSSFLCDAAKDRIKISIVDTWKVSKNELKKSQRSTSIYKIFLENMGDRKFTPIKKESTKASKTFKDESCDVVFINTNGLNKSIKEDLIHWFPKVKEGGYLAGHGIDQLEVSKALEEWSLENNFIISKYKKGLFDHCWFLKKPISINKTSAVVVSSHYNEDLNWVNFVKYPVKVYSKTIKNKNFIDFNKAQEVPAYLKYIVENYDNLPEYSIFVHGHSESYHQKDHIASIINRVKLEGSVINLNLDYQQTISKKDEFVDPKSGHSDLNDLRFYWVENNWKSLIGENLPLPNSLSFPSCAQFAVHKSCIIQYPIEFWQHLFDWCKKTELDNYISSRIFEYIWYYIFSRKADFFE